MKLKIDRYEIEHLKGLKSKCFIFGKWFQPKPR